MKLRIKEYLIFLVSICSISFFLFDKKKYTYLNTYLEFENANLIEIIFLLVFIAILTYIGFIIFKWTVQKKFIEKIKFLDLIFQFSFLVVVVCCSIGYNLHLYYNYEISFSLNELHTITSTLALFTYSLLNIILLKTLFSLVSPAFEKINYTTLQSNIKQIQSVVIDFSKNKVDYSNFSDEIIISLENIKKEIIYVVSFEKSQKEKQKINSLKNDVLVLLELFEKIDTQKNPADVDYLLDNKTGGLINNNQFVNLRKILDLKI